MHKIETLNDLYTEFLRDIYNAEVLLVSHLVSFKMMAQDPQLKTNIQANLNASRLHMQHLEELIEGLDESLMEDHCRSMKSMIKEARKVASRCEEASVKDYAITASLQRINRCKINVYQTLKKMVEDLKLPNHLQVLDNCLNDEYHFEKNLESQMVQSQN